MTKRLTYIGLLEAHALLKFYEYLVDRVQEQNESIKQIADRSFEDNERLLEQNERLMSIIEQQDAELKQLKFLIGPNWQDFPIQ